MGADHRPEDSHYPWASFRGAPHKVTGDYVTAEETGGLFFVNLFGPNEFTDFLFIENPEGPGSYHYEAISEVPSTGVYFFEIEEADGDWRLRIETQ